MRLGLSKYTLILSLVNGLCIFRNGRTGIMSISTTYPESREADLSTSTARSHWSQLPWVTLFSLETRIHSWTFFVKLKGNWFTDLKLDRSLYKTLFYWNICHLEMMHDTTFYNFCLFDFVKKIEIFYSNHIKGR